MLEFALVFYAVIAIAIAFSLGANDLDRGDKTGATFALLFAALWPLAVVMLLGFYIGNRAPKAPLSSSPDRE